MELDQVWLKVDDFAHHILPPPHQEPQEMANSPPKPD